MPDSLCFLEAFAEWSAGRIEGDEYVHHLLVHFQGVRHPLDKLDGDVLGRMDPFAASLRALIFESESVKVEGKKSSCLVLLSLTRY
jgi:hypothetical protein